MNRTVACVLGIAALIVLAPVSARAQMPVGTNNATAASLPSSDAGTSAASLTGLRSWFIDLLQTRAWLGTGSRPMTASTSKAARVPRAGATRTKTWVP